MDGRLLVLGREIEKPAFLLLDDRLWVMFEERTGHLDIERAPTFDLRMVSYLDGEARTLLSNIADRDGWRGQVDGQGVNYFIVDERVVEGGVGGGAGTSVGTLVRLDIKQGELERIPDVASYQVLGGAGPAEFLYRHLPPGAAQADLRLRVTGVGDRSLGVGAGSAQMMGGGKVYFVTGDEKSLSRIADVNAPVEVIRNFVTRFMLGPKEKRVALQVSQGGKSQTIIRDLEDGTEIRVPGDNPCCWLGFSGDQFLYSDMPTGSNQARFHTFDTVTREDEVLTLPPGMSDVSSFLPRPGTGEMLLFDSLGRVARYHPNEAGGPELLDFMPVSPSYSEDGQYLLYIVPETLMPVEGRLMVRDAEFRDPPRQLSPEGSLTQAGGFFFIPEGLTNRILVFWSHYGRNAADLYYGNHVTGDYRVVAEGISEVVVQAHRVLGIIRVSQQDLVGDLVNKDLVLGKEVMLAHRVSDAAFYGKNVAFVVRERIGSRNDGLWATDIDGVLGGRTLDPGQ